MIIIDSSPKTYIYSILYFYSYSIDLLSILYNLLTDESMRSSYRNS